MAVKDLILGLDLGTSSLKGVYFAESGDIVTTFEVQLSLSRSGDMVEQDPNDYCRALKDFFAQSARDKNLVQRIRAIGLSGHTPSLVGIDTQGKPTFPAMIWQDNRAVDEAHQLAERFGDPNPIIGTSLPWSASGTAAKAMWVSHHLSDAAKRTRWLLQPKDYLGYLLTGAAISDPWSTKGLCNVRTGLPIDEILAFAGWKVDVVPALRDGFAHRGVTTSASERSFGVPRDIPVSTGWSDAMCGMLALGVFSQPTSFIITGTSAIVGTSSSHEPKSQEPLYLIPPGSAPYPVTFGPTQMSGGSIAWAAQLFASTELDFVARGDSDVSDDVPIYLPYIAGERAPLWRSDIRGSFSEISVEHGVSAFARATMEGISFAERQVLELSQDLSGTRTSEIILSGRAGNDPHWLKTRLRTLGKKLRVVNDVEITCRGSAILAHAMLSGDISSSTQVLQKSGIEHSPSDHDLEYGEQNFERFLKEQKYLLAKYNKS